MKVDNDLLLWVDLYEYISYNPIDTLALATIAQGIGVYSTGVKTTAYRDCVSSLR
jgi:hypothetical protein